MNQKETVRALLERREARRRQRIIRAVTGIAGVAISVACVACLIRMEYPAIVEARKAKEAAAEPVQTFSVVQVSAPVAEIAVEPVVEAPAEEYIEDFENEKIEAALLAKANRMDNILITHYCSELRPHICGTGDGITASGRKIQPYVSVAVDPKVIPLGSEVMIDYGDGEIHYYRADDVGAWVNGPHIDVAVTTHNEALQLGKKTATVWWIGPEEGGE